MLLMGVITRSYVADQVWISRDHDPRVLTLLVTCGAHYPENESNEALNSL